MEDRQAAYYKKMTETPVSKLIVKLGIPTTISMLVSSIYNTADTYFVGTLGTSASAAVGVVFGLMAIIQAIGFLFGHGSGSIISRKLGQKDVDSASVYASTSFFGSIVFGLLLGVLGLLFLNPFMSLLGSTDTILPYSRVYGSFILITAPVMTSSFTLNNILRYEGMATFGMIGLATGSVLNIFGDWFLITQLNMGIEGAGISTAVSQVISFVLLLVPYLRKKTQTKMSVKNIACNKIIMMDIFETGFPSLIRQGLNSISTMILNGQAAVYGDAAVSAMSIVNRICFVGISISLGIGQGFQPVSGFNYGAKRYDRVKKGFFFTVGLGETCMLIFAVLGLCTSSMLVSVFRNDPEVVRIGTFALRCQLCALLFQPFTVCANMTFQSVGKNKVATFTAVLRSGLLFIPLVAVLPRIIGLMGVQVAQPLADVLTFIITIPFVIRFFRELPKESHL